MDSSIDWSGVDFFATGDQQMKHGLDLNYFPRAQGRGVNLSSAGQTLQQGYQTAKQVFERLKPGSIKFVLISLAPPTLNHEDWTTTLENYFKLCVDNGARPVGVLLPVKQSLRKTLTAVRENSPASLGGE